MTNAIYECVINKNTTSKPIWFMRQAGRYLPEFRKIRKLNPNFINLCLNENLSAEITIQPLKRFDLDAAIIFSDILMLPYALGQEVNFKKNFGPKLGPNNIEKISKVDERDFLKKLQQSVLIEDQAKLSITQKYEQKKEQFYFLEKRFEEFHFCVLFLNPPILYKMLYRTNMSQT